MPNIRDKVLLFYQGISEIGEIRDIRIIRNGEKRYYVIFRDYRGTEIGVWRKITNLTDIFGNPLKEEAEGGKIAEAEAK